MSQTIYVVWRAILRPYAYELSIKERKHLQKLRDESLAGVGGKMVLQLDTQWSNESWPSAGVIKYPNLEALQTHTKNLEALDWFHLYKTETLLGHVVLEEEFELPDPIYVIWRLTVRPNIRDLPEEQIQKKMQARDDSLECIGAKKVLQLDTRWSNEKWQFAGVIKYPGLEALRTHIKNLKGVDWYQVLETETLVGVESGDQR